MTEGQRFVLIRYTSRAGMAFGFILGGWQALGLTPHLFLLWLPVICALSVLAVILGPQVLDPQGQIMREEWQANIKQRQEKERKERLEAAERRMWELRRQVWEKQMELAWNAPHKKDRSEWQRIGVERPIKR